MHELLYGRKKRLEDEDLLRYAGELGLDVARFDQDRFSSEVLGRVGRDVASGLASGTLIEALAV